MILQWSSNVGPPQMSQGTAEGAAEPSIGEIMDWVWMKVFPDVSLEANDAPHLALALPGDRDARERLRLPVRQDQRLHEPLLA